MSTRRTTLQPHLSATEHATTNTHRSGLTWTIFSMSSLYTICIPNSAWKQNYFLSPDTIIAVISYNLIVQHMPYLYMVSVQRYRNTPKQTAGVKLDWRSGDWSTHVTVSWLLLAKLAIPEQNNSLYHRWQEWSGITPDLFDKLNIHDIFCWCPKIQNMKFMRTAKCKDM